MLDANVTLLIIDDDPSIRHVLCEVFRCMGHSVRTAEDGFGALQEMAVAVPDILLSDLNMPRMSGFELLSVVRRRFPSVYVIAMSGAYQRGGVPQGIAADGFYEKASGMVALLQAVSDGVASDRLSISALRKSTPIWVPLGGSHLSDPKQVLLGCPECLRAFPQPLHDSVLSRETSCIHCRAPINYAVVDQYASVM